MMVVNCQKKEGHGGGDFPEEEEETERDRERCMSEERGSFFLGIDFFYIFLFVNYQYNLGVLVDQNVNGPP